jgi:hypothetical protein
LPLLGEERKIDSTPLESGIVHAVLFAISEILIGEEGSILQGKI